MIDLPLTDIKTDLPSILGPDIFEMRMGNKSSNVTRVVMETVSNIKIKDFALSFCAKREEQKKNFEYPS